MKVCLVVCLTTLCFLDVANGTFANFLHNLPTKIADAFTLSWGTLRRIFNERYFNVAENPEDSIYTYAQVESDIAETGTQKIYTKKKREKNTNMDLKSPPIISHPAPDLSRKKKPKIRAVVLPVFARPRHRLQYMWRTDRSPMFDKWFEAHKTEDQTTLTLTFVPWNSPHQRPIGRIKPQMKKHRFTIREEDYIL